ncbi:hypothetical protein [Paenisporosarcina sp. NPDC076898]
MKYVKLGVLTIFLLSACSGESKNGDAEIKRSELTQFEENLL